MKQIFQIAGAIIISFGGAAAVLFGLSNWLGKVWANRILASEKAQHDRVLAEFQAKLQQQTERGVHVHKVQFEKEFLIYQEIWEKLVLLKHTTLALRPTLGTKLASETEEEQKKRLSKDIGNALVAFIKTVENHRPFYADRIYEKLNELSNICYKEAIEYQYGDSKIDVGYWEKAAKNSEIILKIIDEINLRIRDRINDISVA